METQAINAIANGTPGVMIVTTAADLRAAFAEMQKQHQADTAAALAAAKERPTLTREQAAQALNTTLSTLWRWDKMGYLKPTKVGRKVFYRPSQIEEMLARQAAE